MLTNEEMKKCPHCNGIIKKQAVKCKLCQRFIGDSEESVKQDLVSNDNTSNSAEVPPAESVAAKADPDQPSTAPTELLILAAISYVISAIFIGLGFYKIIAYENPESSYGTMVNAYVGGDAYNYIINANYASAYFAMAIFCAVIAMTFILTYYILEISLAISKKVAE